MESRESPIQLALDSPSNYILWNNQIENMVGQWGLETHLVMDVNTILGDYKTSSRLEAGTVPIKVLESERFTKPGLPIWSAVHAAHIRQSASCLYMVILNSLSKPLRLMVGHLKTAKDIVEFVDDRFMAVKSTNQDQVRRMFTSLTLDRPQEYEVFLDKYEQLLNKLSAMGMK